MPYVSRGGEKLMHALQKFNTDVKNKICADFGSSTGGFVDCLIQAGAKKVYAIETGYGVLDWNLRNNPKVICMEKTNALHASLPEKVDFISIDTSWTRQKHIISKAMEMLRRNGKIVSLLKPQYESLPQWRKKSKVKEEYIPKIIDIVIKNLKIQNISIRSIIESPIRGEKSGNKEYLMLIEKI